MKKRIANWLLEKLYELKRKLDDPLETAICRLERIVYPPVRYKDLSPAAKTLHDVLVKYYPVPSMTEETNLEKITKARFFRGTHGSKENFPK